MLSTFAHLQLSLLLCVVVHLSMYFCTTYRTLKLKGIVAQRKVEMLSLRKQASAVFSPSNFAASAKLERRANKIEKDIKGMSTAGPQDKRIALGGTAARGLQAAISLALTLLYARPPVDFVPAELVAPMTNRVAFPFKYEDTAQVSDVAVAGLSMLGWLFLCDRFAAGIASALDSIIVF